MSLLESIGQACAKVISENDSFWRWALPGDWSFEEGTRETAPGKSANRGFCEYVDWLERQSVPEVVIAKLRQGINGLLATSLADYGCRQESWRGHDLTWDCDGRVGVESKYIYDCTLKKYYAEIAKDVQKLSGNRDLSHRFQIVWFTQMPNLRYPPPHRRKTIIAGIESQFAEVCGVIGKAPSWPTNGAPKVHPLSPGDDEDMLSKTITLRYCGSFSASKYEGFHAQDQFQEAAVGVAVWML